MSTERIPVTISAAAVPGAWVAGFPASRPPSWCGSVTCPRDFVCRQKEPKEQKKQASRKRVFI